LTAQQIIENVFRLYVDDTSELSSAEELSLCNRIYKKICAKKPWEFLKKNATGTFAGTIIALPADFLYFAENNQYTDISQEQGVSASKVIFVGTNYSPYRIVNFSDRLQYRNKDGYAYLDLANNQIVFTTIPSAGTTYDFDYIKIPSDLALGDSPIFPSIFHDMIGYGMASDDFSILLFEKAKSYQRENEIKFQQGLQDLEYYNSNLRMD